MAFKAHLLPERESERECGRGSAIVCFIASHFKSYQIAFFTQIRFVFLIGYARNICQHFTMNLYRNGLQRVTVNSGIYRVHMGYIPVTIRLHIVQLRLAETPLEHA